MSCTKEITAQDVDQLDIVHKLGRAFCRRDVAAVGALLAEEGAYEMRQRNWIDSPDGMTLPRWETLTVHTPEHYMIWMNEYLKNEGRNIPRDFDLQYELDQCLLCNIGAPVLLFNYPNYLFQRNSFEDLSQVGGLMIEVKDGLVAGITQCFYHLHNQTD